MAKRKVFTKKNGFILFLISCLGAAVVATVLHAGAATKRIEAAELKVEAAQTQVLELQKEIIGLEMDCIELILSLPECPAPVECADPTTCETCEEPKQCPEPVECPAPVTCEPEIVTVRIVEKEEVIKEIKVPVECPTTPVEEKKLEGFTPYVDFLGTTDGTAGARLGLDKEMVNKGRFSLRLFAEVSHDLVQKDTETIGIEYDPYYCEEFQCTEAVDAPQRDRTRGNFGIRFRF